MSDEFKRGPLLCGACKVPVEGRTDANGHQTVPCPTCGETDTLENATREADEREADKLVGGMFDNFKSSQSGFLKVTVTKPPQRAYRFIIGDESHW